jgi:hypothetical protein
MFLRHTMPPRSAAAAKGRRITLIVGIYATVDFRGVFSGSIYNILNVIDFSFDSILTSIATVIRAASNVKVGPQQLPATHLELFCMDACTR